MEEFPWDSIPGPQAESGSLHPILMWSSESPRTLGFSEGLLWKQPVGLVAYFSDDLSTEALLAWEDVICFGGVAGEVPRVETLTKREVEVRSKSKA